VASGAGGVKKPTMNDVARLAGVSQSTVSVVVNNRAAEIGISDSTRSRVLVAIETLGFRPNLAARGLRLQRSRTFGFITDHIASTPFAGRTVQGAQDVAWRNGHLLMVVNTSADRAIEKSAIDALIDRGADGLLYAAVAWRSVDLPPTFSAIPSVLVNCWSAGGDLVTEVVPREVDGGRLAAEELVSNGHQSIAFLGGTPDDRATSERETGFRRAMAGARLTVQERWVLHGDYGMRSGYRLAAALFEGTGPHPTGLVCGNDRMAAGAMGALTSRSLSVPADVSVVGYDDQADLSDQLTPALTTVSIPHYEMGSAGVEHLLAALSGVPTPRTIPVAGRLIRRASVARPRR